MAIDQLQILETKSGFRSERDFAVTIPSSQVNDLVELLKKEIDITEAYEQYKTKRFGQFDYSVIGKGYVNVRIYGLGTKVCVDFTPSNDIASVQVDRIKSLFGQQ